MRAELCMQFCTYSTASLLFTTATFVQHVCSSTNSGQHIQRLGPVEVVAESCLLCLSQARLAALKREEEWLHREQERLEAEKAQHVRQAFSALWVLHYMHVLHCMQVLDCCSLTHHQLDSQKPNGLLRRLR